MRTGFGTIACALLCLAWIASPALAEESYAESGFYVGVGVPMGVENFDANVSPVFGSLLPPGTGQIDGRSGDHPAFGVRAYAGYRASAYIAAEFEYEWLATKFQKRILGDPLLDARPWTAIVNIKGYLLHGKFQPFVRVGAGWMSNDLFLNLPVSSGGGGSTDFTIVTFKRNVSGMVTKLGGGVEIYGNDHAAVSVDFSYVLPLGESGVQGFGYWSIGLFDIQYRF